MTAKKRLFYLDLIRTVALVCILIVHFNATVTGYFTYPSLLFGSTLPGGIYLGDFGSTLFFIVSGAALAYTVKTPFSPVKFYKKRAKAVYPMFWLAWMICFSIRFVRKPWYYANTKAATFPLTVLGLDNFAVAAGWVSSDFACVGEWFLGSILFLYLLFPALRYGMEHSPAKTWAVALLCALPAHLLQWDNQLLAIHLLEFLFGMTAVRFSAKLERMGRNPLFLAGAALVWPILVVLHHVWPLDHKLICALAGCAVFLLLFWAAQYLECGLTKMVCRLTGKYSYAIFLVHHVIIQRLVEGRDLSAVTRRDTVLLFLCYLFWVAVAAYALYRLERFLRQKIADFAAQLRAA